MDFEAGNAIEWLGRAKPVPNPIKTRLPPLSHPLPPKPAAAGVKALKPTKPLRNATKKPKPIPKKFNFRRTRIDPSRVLDWNKFALNKDSAAKESWRRRRQPTGQYKIPPNFMVVHQSAVKAQPLHKHPRPSAFQTVLDQIGVQTGAFIEAPIKASARLLPIWGNLNQVEAAKAQLQALIERYRTAQVEWVKVGNQSEIQKLVADRKIEEEAIKQSFRQDPPDNETFQYQGVFLWPTSGFPQSALLGPNLEAFDPIRTALCCFIQLQPKTSWIRLFSNRSGSIEKALQRIQTTLREIVVRSRSATKIYMLDPLQPGQAKREIELVARNDPGKEAVDGDHPAVVPTMVGDAPSEAEKETWVALRPTVGRANRKCLERAAVTILKRLRYFRGDISMRVRLGTLVLQSYKKPPEGEYTLEDLFTMLRNPQSSGQVIREYRNTDKETGLIAICRAANDVLTPIDPVTPSLADVEPDFSATFDVRTSSNPFPMRLVVKFTKDMAGHLMTSSAQWLKRGTSGLAQDANSELRREKVPLSLVTLNLQKNTAWELAIFCKTIIDQSQITPAMQSFVESIVVDSRAKGRATATTNNDVDNFTLRYNQSELRVDSYTMIVHHRYFVKGSTYVFELTQEQTTRLKFNEKTGPPSTTWKASLYNIAWEKFLEGQSYLLVGEVPSQDVWHVNVETLFPDDLGPGTGVRHFLDKIQRVSRLVEREETNLPETTPAKLNVLDERKIVFKS